MFSKFLIKSYGYIYYFLQFKNHSKLVPKIWSAQKESENLSKYTIANTQVHTNIYTRYGQTEEEEQS